MGEWLVQDLVVTAVAFGAIAVIGRRLVGFLTPSRPGTGCSNCASGRSACAPAASGSAPATQSAHPLVLIRPSGR